LVDIRLELKRLQTLPADHRCSGVPVFFCGIPNLLKFLIRINIFQLPAIGKISPTRELASIRMPAARPVGSSLGDMGGI
jgi:hypothetical protein